MMKCCRNFHQGEKTDLATDVQSDGEFSSMRQTRNSQEVSEIRTRV